MANALAFFQPNANTRRRPRQMSPQLHARRHASRALASSTGKVCVRSSSSAVSLKPGQSDVTTGTPAANASRRLKGWPSQREGITQISNVLKTGRGSLNAPKNCESAQPPWLAARDFVATGRLQQCVSPRVLQAESLAAAFMSVSGPFEVPVARQSLRTRGFRFFERLSRPE